MARRSAPFVEESIEKLRQERDNAIAQVAILRNGLPVPQVVFHEDGSCTFPLKLSRDVVESLKYRADGNEMSFEDMVNHTVGEAIEAYAVIG